MRADLGLDRGGFARIGAQSRHDVNPVEGVQLIEVRHVVLRVQGRVDQVADDVGVLRNLPADGVLDGAHGGKGVNAGADAADAFDECPGVARIAALEDDFQTAPHRARGIGVGKLAVVTQDSLNAQMTFDSGYGVNNNAVTHVCLLQCACC